MRIVQRVRLWLLVMVMAATGPVGAQFVEDVPTDRKLYVGEAELWRWRTAYRPLFDGATLDGWEVRGAAQWTVEDGALVGRPARGEPGGRGFVVSRDQYANFILRFQFSTMRACARDS